MSDIHQTPEQEAPKAPAAEASEKDTHSVQEKLHNLSQMVIKKAPEVLKKSLTLAGNGAEALGKALHKMSAMVQTEEQKTDPSDASKQS